MIEMKEPKIERRGFLKLSGGVAGLAVFGSKLLGKPKEALVETAKTGKAATEDGWYPGLCKFCMQGDCQTRVHVVDGVVVGVVVGRGERQGLTLEAGQHTREDGARLVGRRRERDLAEGAAA